MYLAERMCRNYEEDEFFACTKCVLRVRVLSASIRVIPVHGINITLNATVLRSPL
jgi:hypothetical protein